MRSAVVVGRLAVLRCTVICLAIAACLSNRATQPQDGAQNSVLIVQIVTDGHDVDSDGYRLWIGTRDYPVEVNDTLVVTDLPPAAYPLSLADVALNCNPSPGNVSVIQVTADTSVATVAVHCGATLNGRLVFSTTRGGNWEIYSIRLDGSDPVNLTNDPASDGWPTISLALDQIFFVSSRPGRHGVYRMKPDGAEVQYVVAGTGPSVSPDGTRLAYMPDSINGEIFVLRLDNGSVTNLTKTPLRWEGLPQWSPDGMRIAFGAADGNGDHMFVMNADGSNVTEVIPGMPAYWPRWSPDGTKLVFSGYQAGDSLTGDLGWDLYTAGLDGSSLSRLLRNPGDDIEPSWSRDGQWIAFTSLPPSGPADILVVPANKGTPRSLTNHQGDNTTAGWGRP